MKCFSGALTFPQWYAFELFSLIKTFVRGRVLSVIIVIIKAPARKVRRKKPDFFWNMAELNNKFKQVIITKYYIISLPVK